MPKKVRMDVLMTNETGILIEILQARIGATTLTETLRCALALLDLVTAQQSMGKTLWVRTREGVVQEIQMPWD